MKRKFILMDLKKLFKGFISLGAIYYTALSTVIILIATALSAENASKLLSPKQFLFLLLFCYLMSLGSAIKIGGGLPGAVAYTVHAVCYILGFVLFLTLCGVKFVPIAIASLIFVILYTAVAVIKGIAEKKHGAPTASAKLDKATAATCKKAKRKKPKKSVEYVSQFSSASKNSNK